ncbi:hypothetical protein Tel_08555 [Candidatus Tenderia electrophaga]|uniref:Uncharacterized protein n=1 Tax=Candidatus Tenderia electrophaga TaxID=1748243 RepID=A0A0S2TDK4_9GAMM|nr:hypothetical protein Tel_08555 [Candidatus Tenderia electrophaga]
MGHDKNGGFSSNIINSIHNSLLGLIIQSTRGFIKYDNISLLIKRTCYTYSLTLPTGKAHSSFTNNCLVL